MNFEIETYRKNRGLWEYIRYTPTDLQEDFSEKDGKCALDKSGWRLNNNNKVIRVLP